MMPVATRSLAVMGSSGVSGVKADNMAIRPKRATNQANTFGTHDPLLVYPPIP